MFVRKSTYAAALAEIAVLKAELARWKPIRDAKGHFVKAEAVQ